MKISRGVVTGVAALAIALAGSSPAVATDPLDAHPGAGDHADAPAGPSEIVLPTGFRPEGIEVGPGDVAYVGSLADGSILRADLRTGAAEVFSPGVGHETTGLELDDRGRLFAAGGASGTARVVDPVTGAVVADYQLAAAGARSLVNDVVVTEDAAWFTDTVNKVLYQLPLGRFGQLPAPGEVVTLPLTGDVVYDDQLITRELNGIETTPDGSALLVVQSSTGLLFRVDTVTGETTTVDLGGELVVNGDGLTREGNTLYVVQNLRNQVSVVLLDHDGLRGHVEQRLTDPRFDNPTTVAINGDRLYLPNARLFAPSPETASYDVVSIPRPRR